LRRGGGLGFQFLLALLDRAAIEAAEKLAEVESHHHMPAGISNSAMSAGAFHRHDKCVRTAIRGALIPKVCRTRRPMARIVGGIREEPAAASNPSFQGART